MKNEIRKEAEKMARTYIDRYTVCDRIDGEELADIITDGIYELFEVEGLSEDDVWDIAYEAATEEIEIFNERIKESRAWAQDMINLNRWIERGVA